MSQFDYLLSTQQYKHIIIQSIKIEHMSLTQMYNYIGNRTKTCYYRFDQVLTSREKHFYCNGKPVPNPNLETAKSQILQSVDVYVNCLRGEFKGGQLPQVFAPKVHQFKKLVYEELQPGHVLEDFVSGPLLREFYQHAKSI